MSSSSSASIAVCLALALVPRLSAAQGVWAGNPALAFTRVDSTAAEVSVAWRSSSALNSIVEEGDGWRGLSAAGGAIMRPSAGWVAWGDAAYEKGVRSCVVMSESADFGEVGPMAVADTIGGDKDSEKYAFSAGFAWRRERWMAGLSIGYSSLCEFRTHDPRPKADAVRAEVRLGGGLMLGRYTFGLSGLLGKYSQEVDVDFYNAQGASVTVYHMTGLGADYSRFSGPNAEAAYKGRKVGGGVDFSGPFTVAAEYSRRHVEKMLPDLHNAMICETFDDAVSVRLSRAGSLSVWETELSAYADAHKLSLDVAIYDDGSTNYRQIATRGPYSQTERRVGLSAQMRREAGMPASMRSSVACVSVGEENTDVRRKVEVQNVEVAVAASLSHAMGRVTVSWSAGALARANVGKSCALGVARPTESPAAVAAVREDFLLRSSSAVGLEADVRVEVGLPSRARSAFVALSGDRLWRSGDLPVGWGCVARVGVSL